MVSIIMNSFYSVVPIAAVLMSYSGSQHDRFSQEPPAVRHAITAAEARFARDTVLPPLLGATLQYGMDTSVSPCENFYQYVNGGWRVSATLGTEPIPPRVFSTFDDVYRRGQAKIERYIDSVARTYATTTDPIVRLTGSFFSSCLQADTIEARIARLKRGARQPIDSSRKQLCIARTLEHLEMPVGQAFAKSVLPDTEQHRVERILDAIQIASMNRVRHNPWMSDTEKTVAIDRLEKLQLRVGFPANMIDYSDLILSDDYRKNVVAIKEYEHTAKLQQIGGNDREIHKQRLLTANAFYTDTDHAIEIPPLMFLPPFFDRHDDDALIFGGIGQTIGHEIFHSVVTPLRRARDSTSVAVFNRFKHFYATLGELDGWSVKPDLSLDEDLADLGGVLVAYDAFKAYTASKPRDTIDGYTPDQRFFIAVARIWRATWAGNSLSLGGHGPPFARVHSMIANSPAFVIAFGCKASDKMVLNAADQPNVW